MTNLLQDLDGEGADRGAVLLEEIKFRLKWQREHTTTLDTDFGKITLIASPFLKDGQIAVYPTEPPREVPKE